MLLKLNSQNEQVKVIQEFLGLTTDGIFGAIIHTGISAKRYEAIVLKRINH